MQILSVFIFVRINGHYLFPWIIKTGHWLHVIVPFLLSILATPRQSLPYCSYLKVAFFGWLFVSYLPVLTSIFPSSFLGNRMLCLFTLLVTVGPLTCWMWTSPKKTIWLDVRDGSCSLSYQDGSCPIYTSSLFGITNNTDKVKWVKLLSLFSSLFLIFHLLFLFWKYV